MSRYSKWAKKEHSLGTRILATLPAGLLLAILIPLVILFVCPSWDQKLGLPSFYFGTLNFILGGLLIVMGLSFAFWSILVQFERGRGTPLPMLPTQELLIQGPFRYCRNPMTFGTILAYLGLGIIAGSITGICLAIILAGLLILYLKRMEEKELAERFGEAYLRYKEEVPFMIPRLPKRHSSKTQST
jgi:protein-S-isoprenylcysteine O-methyltransferase Ste14